VLPDFDDLGLQPANGLVELRPPLVKAWRRVLEEGLPGRACHLGCDLNRPSWDYGISSDPSPVGARTRCSIGAFSEKAGEGIRAPRSAECLGSFKRGDGAAVVVVYGH
jgi:hypothetical protein